MCVSTSRVFSRQTSGTVPPRFSAARAKPTCPLGGFAKRGFGGVFIRRRSLRFLRSEKSDGCPTAKLPSDAKRRFWFVSVNTEMNKKTYKRVFAVFVLHKPLGSSEIQLIKQHTIGFATRTHQKTFPKKQ